MFKMLALPVALAAIALGGTPAALADKRPTAEAAKTYTVKYDKWFHPNNGKKYKVGTYTAATGLTEAQARKMTNKLNVEQEHTKTGWYDKVAWSK